MLYWLENKTLEPYEAEQSRSASYRRVSESSYRRALRASDIMSRPVRTVEASQPLHEAHQLMQELGLAHLAVLDSGEFSGILSDRDILYAEDRSDFVGFHMSRQLVMASPAERITRIASSWSSTIFTAFPFWTKISFSWASSRPRIF